MLRILPIIFGSFAAGVRDLRGNRSTQTPAAPRTERDLPIWVVVAGSLGLIIALAAVPSLGLGLSLAGVAGAVMVLLFGFLFVTVSSRLTGEIGSSSNPISGMTIATLLLVCLIFWGLNLTDSAAQLAALTIASVVCIAASNGGTTSQDLKTGYLVGATPYKQQYAILIGALTSAAVIGLTLIAMNSASTVYTKRNLPTTTIANVTGHTQAKERPGQPYADDQETYNVIHVRKDQPQFEGIRPGRYLVDDAGAIVYRSDPGIYGELKYDDFDQPVPKRFTPPQPQLFESIITGMLSGSLEWSLLLIGVMIALALELAGVSSLPFAVGMYIEFQATTTIFLGGLARWLIDRRKVQQSDAEAETSPAVLYSSGLIAGGTLAGVLLAFSGLIDKKTLAKLSLSDTLYGESPGHWPDVVSLVVFLAMAGYLLYVGRRQPDKLGASQTPRE